MAKNFWSFMTGAAVGAAGAAAYFILRDKEAPAPQQQPMPAAAPAAAEAFGGRAGSAASVDWGNSERAQLQEHLQASRSQQQESEQQLAALRDEFAASTAWQAKVPTLTLLGQTLARLPAYKAAAADAAIAVARLPETTQACQDLATVHGIGVTYEQRLYQAGVGTFWELAHLGDEDFAQLLHLTKLQQRALDPNAIRAEAKGLAVETNTVGVLWDGEPPDDFELVKGIGKVFEQRLYDAGIRTYRALASATVEELADLCQGHAAVAPDFAAWITQAQTLLAART